MKKTLALMAVSVALPLFAFGNAASTFIKQGDALDAQMETAKALDAYLQAEKLDPKNPELLIKIATQYGESMVDLPSVADQKSAGLKALDYSKRAAELAPDLSDAYLAIAICYGRLLNKVSTKQKVAYSKDVKTAVDHALQLDPKSDYAWHLLGRWQRSVAEIDGLKRGIAKLIYGKIPKAEIGDSIASLKRAIELNPDRLSHHVELGISYAEAGEIQKARSSLERGLSMPNRERDDPNTKARGREVLKALDS